MVRAGNPLLLSAQELHHIRRGIFDSINQFCSTSEMSVIALFATKCMKCYRQQV